MNRFHINCSVQEFYAQHVYANIFLGVANVLQQYKSTLQKDILLRKEYLYHVQYCKNSSMFRKMCATPQTVVYIYQSYVI